jgi:hypothetical protein
VSYIVEAGRAGGFSATFVMRVRTEPCFRMFHVHLPKLLPSVVTVAMIDPTQQLDRVMGALASDTCQRLMPDACGQRLGLDSGTREESVNFARLQATLRPEPGLVRQIEGSARATADG